MYKFFSFSGNISHAEYSTFCMGVFLVNEQPKYCCSLRNTPPQRPFHFTHPIIHTLTHQEDWGLLFYFQLRQVRWGLQKNLQLHPLGLARTKVPVLFNFSSSSSSTSYSPSPPSWMVPILFENLPIFLLLIPDTRNQRKLSFPTLDHFLQL